MEPSPTAGRRRTPGWRVLPLAVGPPRQQVDAGRALLDRLVDDPTPTLRWYASTSTAVVLGRGQAAIAPLGDVEVLARHSGGGAVLMDPDLLSLDVAVPAGHPILDGDMTAVFGRVGAAWARGLAELGVTDLTVYDGPNTARRRGSPREQLLAAVCYATLGRGEVLAGDRKLVGLAQRRRRHGALVQCGLLRRWRPHRLLAALGGDPDDEEVAQAAVGLDELGHADLENGRIAAAVSRALTG
jgi:lipoate-protein ligase A